MAQDQIKLVAGMRMRVAFAVALLADAVQLLVMPMFIEGAASPADDMLDLGIGAVLVYLLGWHWEFLPSFAAKLVPGVDMVPFWTLSVANVYRRSKRMAAMVEAGRAPFDASRP